MTTHIEREFEAYRKDDHEARAILDLATEEKRDLTAEEEQRFEALVTSADGHKARADKLAKMDKDAADLGETVRSFVAEVADTSTGSTEARGLDAGLLDNIRAVQDAYRKYGSFDGELWDTSVINLEKRAIADFSDNGALYTTDFATNVAIYQRTVSPWINLASIINADNGRPINLPNLTADPTAYKPGEGTAITESTPTIGSAALTTSAYKALSYVSMEAEQDELVGLLRIIAQVQGRSIGYQFGTALSATIVAAATNGGTATGAGGGGGTNGTALSAFVGYEDLLTLKYGIAIPYRQAGSWVVANAMLLKMRKFKDGQGQYLWQNAVAAGEPPTFDGNAVYEDPGLAAPASVTKSVLFGDLSAVVIKQMPLRVATSVDFKFDTDQVALKSVYRAGGALPDAAAIRYLISANT